MTSCDAIRYCAEPPAHVERITFRTPWSWGRGSSSRRLERSGERRVQTGPRDGQLKLIECNARFTASNAWCAEWYRSRAFRLQPLDRPTVAADRPLRRRATHVGPHPRFPGVPRLHRAVNGSPQWLADVFHRQSFPYFEWSDPLPALVRLCRPFTKGREPAPVPFRSPPGGRPHAERPDHADAVAAPAGRYRDCCAVGFTPIDPPGCHRLSESDLIAALSDAECATGRRRSGHGPDDSLGSPSARIARMGVGMNRWISPPRRNVGFPWRSPRGES